MANLSNINNKFLVTTGGAVLINQTSAVSTHLLTVNGKIGGPTFSDSYLQFTGGNALLKANDDVKLGYTQDVVVKQSGSVGIGTTSPNASLTVVDNSDGSSTPLVVASGDGSFDVNQEVRIGFSQGPGSTFSSSASLGHIGFVYTGGSFKSDFIVKTNTTNASDQSEKMRITSSGNVGIGTASPSHLLSVGTEGNSSGRKISLYLGGGDENFAGIGAQRGESNLFCSSEIRFINESNSSGSGAFAIATGVNSLTERMRINHVGVTTITRSPFFPAASLDDVTTLKLENKSQSFGGSAAGIQLNAGDGDTIGTIFSRADGNNNSTEALFITTNTDNPIIFGTNTGTAGVTSNERMRITEGGNVGIGVTSPAEKLHIRDDSTDADVYIKIANDSRDWFMGVEGSNSDILSFKTHDASNLLNITSAGNVGIGNTSPPQKLTVNGGVFITDDITSPGSAGTYTYNGTAIDYASNGTRYWSWGSGTARGTFNFIQLENDGTNQQTALSIDSSGNATISAGLFGVYADFNQGIYDNTNGVRILNPGGGSSNSLGNSGVTGAIKITLPVSWSNTMMRMTIKVYDYSANKSFTVVCGGYNYGPSSAWINEFAYIESQGGVDVNYSVRFGYDGSKCVIYIGELTTVWSYPKVYVTDVQLGFSGLSASNWRTGWAVSIEASAFGTITHIETNCQINNWRRNGSSLYYGQSGNVGIGSASPRNKLTVKTPGSAQVETGLRLINPYGFANVGTGSKIVFAQDRNDSENLEMAAIQSSQKTAGSSIHGDLVFYTRNSTLQERFRITFSGNLIAPAVYNLTTGTAANMVVDSNGFFYRSTSSLKYKEDVRDYDKGLNEVMQLQPKYYKGKTDGDKQFAGLIAEDVHDLGLTEFVQYADDGSPDALSYSHMIALLTKSIQELKAEIDELKK